LRVYQFHHAGFACFNFEVSLNINYKSINDLSEEGNEKENRFKKRRLVLKNGVSDLINNAV